MQFSNKKCICISWKKQLKYSAGGRNPKGCMMCRMENSWPAIQNINKLSTSFHNTEAKNLVIVKSESNASENQTKIQARHFFAYDLYIFYKVNWEGGRCIGEFIYINVGFWKMLFQKKMSLFRVGCPLLRLSTYRKDNIHNLNFLTHNGNTVTNPKKCSQCYHALQFLMQIQFLTLMLEFLSKTDQCHTFSCMRDAISTASTPRSQLPLPHWTAAHQFLYITLKYQLYLHLTSEPSLSHKRIFRQLFQSGTELWGRQKRKTAACPIYINGSVLFYDRWWKVFRLPILGWPQLQAGVANTNSQT